MKAVVILDNYWFFSTSFFLFIYSKEVDCADALQVGVQEEAVSFIFKRHEQGIISLN